MQQPAIQRAKDQFRARGLDLGFGYTKFTKSHLQQDWSLLCDSIPSLAPAGAIDGRLGAGSALSQLDVASIDVEGQVYSVGPDALKAAPGSFRRLLDESFFTAPQYLALARGALYYMSLPDGAVIDCLAVGLPLNSFSDRNLRASIAARLTGEHALPARPGSAKGHKVTVRDVLVLPQAMGALISQAQSNNGLGTLDQESHLVIDVGFGTLLWMVSQGSKPMPARSGETAGGLSTLLQSIAADIGPGLDKNAAALDRIDRALQDPDFELKIRGQKIDMAPYRGRCKAVITEHVGAMLRSLGSCADIDNIYVCGGGGMHYLPMLQEAFKDYEIKCSPERARWENVRGYQILAERRAVHLVERSLAAA